MSFRPGLLRALLLGGAALLAGCAVTDGAPRRQTSVRPIRPLPGRRVVHHPPHLVGHTRR
ncbi:MAG: hypothetical protein ACRYFX_26045 [Janthinobacterium lividum]